MVLNLLIIFSDQLKMKKVLFLLNFICVLWSEANSYRVFKYKPGVSINECSAYLLKELQLEETFSFLSYRDDVPLFSSSEQFSLEEMVKKNVITKEQKEFYLKTTFELDTEQLTYVDMAESILGNPKSTLRMVSGQSLSSYLGKVSSDKKWYLPWMKEFPEFGELQRDKYKYIWELGRAAATEHKLIQENLGILTFLAYRELHLLKGSLDEAFVFIHSTSKINTRLYIQKYGFETHLSLNNGHDILVQPLKKMMKNIPKEVNFANIKLLEDFGLNLDESLNVLNELSRIKTKVISDSNLPDARFVHFEYDFKYQKLKFEEIIKREHLSEEIELKLKNKFFNSSLKSPEHTYDFFKERLKGKSEEFIQIKNYNLDSIEKFQEALTGIGMRLEKDFLDEGATDSLERIKRMSFVIFAPRNKPGDISILERLGFQEIEYYSGVRIRDVASPIYHISGEKIVELMKANRTKPYMTKSWLEEYTQFVEDFIP